MTVNNAPAIVGLKGQWYALSPGSPLSRPIAEIVGPGRLKYPTVRKAYHAVRTRDVGFKARVVGTKSVEELMALIPQIPEHPEWPLVKERVMMELMREKFADVTTKQLLLSTGERILVHRSETNDLYWGTNSRGEGHNRYGHLLMKLRSEFHQEQQAA